MAMKKIAFLSVKIFVLVLTVVLLVTGVTACGKSSSTTTTGDKYKLVHNLPDLEYILPWDTIAARIPDMNDPAKYDKEEAYAGRGNAAGFASLDSNSPAMWLAARVVNMKSEGNRVRNLSIFLWYFDTEKEFDEHMNTLQVQGISVQKDGEFITAVVEQKTPVQTAQLVIAGNHLCILIADVASPDESLIFGKEDLTEMLPTIKSKIASIEITPLPYPRIPRR
jgi:hypothetical protein